MRPIHFFSAVAAAALFVASPLGAPGAGAKTSSFMSECSAKWKAAKANGSVPTGMKWPEFMKTMCDHGTSNNASSASDSNASDSSWTTSSAVVPSTTSSGSTTSTAASTATVQPPSSSGGNFMSDCSAAWKKLKAANSVPSGLTWKQFVKQKCVVDASSPSSASSSPSSAPSSSGGIKPSATTPPEPTQTSSNELKPTQDWHSIPVAKTDKNGKPFSQGQIEAHQRIKECAAEWHAAKANNTLPAGEKWPHFWSTCNTRLKAKN